MMASTISANPAMALCKVTFLWEPKLDGSGRRGAPAFASCSHGGGLLPSAHAIPAAAEELSDADIVAVLCEAMAGAGRLPRSADVYLAGICAEHLVDRLRAAGLQVIRPVQWQVHR